MKNCFDHYTFQEEQIEKDDVRANAAIPSILLNEQQLKSSGNTVTEVRQLSNNFDKC